MLPKGRSEGEGGQGVGGVGGREADIFSSYKLVQALSHSLVSSSLSTCRIFNVKPAMVEAEGGGGATEYQMLPAL